MSVFELRAVADNLEHGVLAGDLVAVERVASAAAGELVVDAEGSLRRFEPGMVVLGRVLVVAGRRQ